MCRDFRKGPSIEDYDKSSMDAVPMQWARFVREADEIPGRLNGESIGVHYPVSQDPPRFEYLTAVPISDDAPIGPAFVERRLPATRCAIFTLTGHISGLGGLFRYVFGEWLPGSGHEPLGNPLFLERYPGDFDPVARTGSMEVRVPLRA